MAKRLQLKWLPRIIPCANAIFSLWSDSLFLFSISLPSKPGRLIVLIILISSFSAHDNCCRTRYNRMAVCICNNTTIFLSISSRSNRNTQLIRFITRLQRIAPVCHITILILPLIAQSFTSRFDCELCSASNPARIITRLSSNRKWFLLCRINKAGDLKAPGVSGIVWN